jgi:predicted dienelactone hydrolase
MNRLICFFIFTVILLSGVVRAQNAVYSPLSVSGRSSPEWLDFTVNDTERQRNIPIRVYFSSAQSASPVILYSHGWGGSREGSAYLGNHWAGRGYVTVYLQHPGSDISVFHGQPTNRRKLDIQSANIMQNFLVRVRDVSAVLDRLEQWNITKGHDLSGKMNLESIGMCGHSFGAATTQAVSGQRFGAGEPMFTDTRIDAAVIMSPNSPNRGTPQTAFNKVMLPWMLMTGTKDYLSNGGADIESRLAVFPALPSGDKYELVLYEAEHMAFTDRSFSGAKMPRNMNHHQAILSLSTAFWDTYLRKDDNARHWLQGDGPKSVLEKNDRWQWK